MKYSGLALVWGSDIRDLKSVLKTHAGDGPSGVKAFELCTQNWLGWKSDTAGHVCNPRLGQRMREDRKIKVFHSCINSSRPSFATQDPVYTQSKRMYKILLSGLMRTVVGLRRSLVSLLMDISINKGQQINSHVSLKEILQFGHQGN